MDKMEIPLSSLVFTKPKKCGEYLVCKLEKKSELVIQFPKMIIKSFTSKNIELEFQNDNVYTKKVYNHLSELDQFVIDYIFKNSEEWFGKEIPLDSMKSYGFIEDPEDTYLSDSDSELEINSFF